MSPYAASLAHRVDWNPQPDITSAGVVVRRALLCKFDPVLTKSQTEKAGTIVKKRWPSWKNEYLRKMEEIAGIAAGEFTIKENEYVRYRYDGGKTPMIDLPLIRTDADAEFVCDQRNCGALCVEKDYSSKIWTRVGIPIESRGCSKDDLRAMTERFRAQAASACESFYEQFFDMTASAFSSSRRTRNQEVLEITTIGLRVDETLTEDAVDAYLFDGDSANLASDELCEYLAAAANMDVDDLRRNSGEFDWMAMPATMLSGSGTVVSRRIPYFTRTVGDVVQIIGIGFDDSGRGEMANDAALKLSRIIANWI
jgi:hypothetical protein